MENLFTEQTANEVINRIHNELKFPYVHAYASSLGGAEHVAIMLTISADAKENWSNGILENSRYGHIHIYNNGTAELFSGNQLKMRKFTAKSVNQLIEKINQIKSKNTGELVASNIKPEHQEIIGKLN